MTTAARRAFVVESLEVGDVHQRKPHITATCSVEGCGFVESILISKHKGNVPPGVGEKFFRQRGWHMGSSRSKDKCPACSVMSRAGSQKDNQGVVIGAIQVIERRSSAPEVEIMPEPQQRTRPALVVDNVEPESKVAIPIHERARAWRAGLTEEERLAHNKKIAEGRRRGRAEREAQADAEAKAARRSEAARTASLARWAKRDAEAAASAEPAPAEVVATVRKIIAEPEPLRADPPPQPTRMDKRRIKEALDDHYNVEHQMYRGSVNDRALAEQLDVPPAWVSELREDLYGPAESEADEKTLAEVKAIADQLGQIETDILKAYEHFEDEVKALNAQLDRVNQRRAAELEKLSGEHKTLAARQAEITKRLGIKG